jgi:hypothetical protein
MVITREQGMQVWAGLPGQVTSQNVSQEFPLAFWQTAGLPDAIPVEPAPPVFSSGVEQLDLFRVLMLMLGIVIGVKVLR